MYHAVDFFDCRFNLLQMDNFFKLAHFLKKCIYYLRISYMYATYFYHIHPSLLPPTLPRLFHRVPLPTL